MLSVGGMSPVRFVYLAGPVVTVVAGAALAYWIRDNHWHKQGAKAFVGVLAVGGGWVTCLFVHLLVTDPATQRLAVIVQGFGALLSMAAFSVFASVYADRGFHRRRWFQAAVVGVPVAIALLSVTNASHRLAWRSITPVSEPFPYAVIDLGPAAVLGVATLVALNGYCWFALVNYLLSTRRGSGTQLVLLLLGAMSIAVAQLLGASGLLPAEGLNHAAYGTVAFVVFSTFGLFRFSLLDVLPVARKVVVESLNDPVFVLDAERRIVDANDAARETWPDAGGVDGPGFADACPELADRIEIADSGVASPPDRVTVTVDGQERHYSVNTTTVARGRTDEVNWYVLLLREVTELERSRWQLQKQNERLDQVAATVSHDLRNPISVADGYAQSLELRVEDWDIAADEREQATANLTRVQESLTRMEEIIEDVLTIAREGKAVEETESVALSSVAREAWSNVDTGDATLAVTEDSIVEADRGRLLSIFENLFRNSVEHSSTSNRTKSGDSVEHGSTGSRNSERSDDSVEHGSTSNRTASGDGGGRAVAVRVGATADGFAVADDGPGIPDEHRDSVFEYGYSTDDEGTGLGLAIVRAMAESHGWTVELDADYGDGTRVVFRGVTSFHSAAA